METSAHMTFSLQTGDTKQNWTTNTEDIMYDGYGQSWC